MNVGLAQARTERKKEAAMLRREVRSATKALKALVADLCKPKSDIWSLASQIEAKAMELKLLQKSLNAILNRGDEVKILKRAARQTVSTTVASPWEQCGECGHRNHLGYCHEAIHRVYPNIEVGGDVVYRSYTFVAPCGCLGEIK